MSSNNFNQQWNQNFQPQQPLGNSQPVQPLGTTGLNQPQKQPKKKPNQFVRAGSYTLVFLAILWAVHIVNVLMHHQLIYYGIKPRDTDALAGILFSPFIHVDFNHLVMNSSVLLVVMFLVALSGRRGLWLSGILIVLVGGLGVWLIGDPRSVHVGASGLVYGWLAFLIARGFFNKNPTHMMLGIIVGITYAGTAWGLMPTQDGVSWEGHLCGALAGVLAAGLGLASNKKNNDPPKPDPINATLRGRKHAG